MISSLSSEVIPPALQGLIALLALLVKYTDIVVPNPDRIDRAVNWMKSIIREDKVNAMTELVKNGIAEDSLSASSSSSGSNIGDLSESFVREWDRLSEEEKEIKRAHQNYEVWRGRLFLWFLCAAVLGIVTLIWPGQSLYWGISSGVLFVIQVVVIGYIYRCAAFLTDLRKKQKYVKARE